MTRWFPSGKKLEEREFFIQDGHEFGTLSKWYENGQIRIHAPYVDRQHHGRVRSWHENGLLAIDAHYTLGNKDGPVEVWDPDGQLKARYIFAAGELKETAGPDEKKVLKISAESKSPVR